MFGQEDGNEDFERESEQYQRGYLHDMDDVQRKIRLINREVVVNKGRLNSNHPSTSSLNIEKINDIQKYIVVNKEVENKTEKTKEMKQTSPVDVEKFTSIFNL